MIGFSSQATIGRPIAEVRDFLGRIERYGEWMPVENARVLSGRPDQAGSVIAMIMSAPGGRRYDMEFEVSEANERGFVWRVLRGGPMRGHYRAQLESIGDSQTTVTYSGELQLTGLWRLLTPLVAREVSRGEANELKKIKQILESAPVTAGTATAA